MVNPTPIGMQTNSTAPLSSSLSSSSAQAPELLGVASDDLLRVFDGVGGVEDVPEALLGVADGAFGVRVVATPEDVVDADQIELA